MRVVTLVPRRASPERDRLWEFTRRWWSGHHPEFTIYEGDHDDGGPFNRSAAINVAARDAGDWDVAIILDADVIVDPDAVRASVDLAINQGVIAMAGDGRADLTERGTERVLHGFRGNWAQRGIMERIWRPHWSSCIVVRRELWDRVGGFDELFIGWGYEDDAFRIACEAWSGHPMVSAASTIWHLWHSQQPGATLQGPNRARAERYNAAAGDTDSLRALAMESSDLVPRLRPLIPRMIHRTVPEVTTREVERFWSTMGKMHPGWELLTFREPLNPADFPLTSSLWGRCTNGAQKAGLVRLELLVTCGGVYVDSDVEPVRPFDPLLYVPAFAAWEDHKVIPDAVLGSIPNHPAMVEALNLARTSVQRGEDAWHSGPGVTTAVLPDRGDVLVLPPGAFYPYHYLQKATPKANDGPWVFARHHWHGSWLSPEQRAVNERRQQS